MTMNYIIFVLSIILVTTQATELTTLLVNNPSLFKPCETNMCFVFRSEKPIIILDPSMRSFQQQILFKCRERALTFPRLKGPFFDLLDELQELHNAHCIWAGSNSTFDGIVQFVQNVSRGARPLQFVTGGMLFQMSHRISNGSIPSSSMRNVKINVVSANQPSWKSFLDAMDRITGPFGHGTWWLLMGFIIFFALLYFLINFCFVKEKTLDTMYNAMLEPFLPRHWLLGNGADEVVRDEDSRESRNYLIRVWIRSAILFFVITTLFYEIGVVNFVINYKPYVLPFLLRGMRLKTLKQFVVNEGSAFEVILRNLALPGELGKSARPWKTVQSFDNVFDTLSDAKNGETRYCLSPDQTAMYELNNRGLCAKLAIHDTSEPLPDYSAVWYYSSHVSLNTRSILDSKISLLRDQGRIQKLVEASVGKITLPCHLKAGPISIFVLLVPLGIVLGPIFLFIMGALLVRLVILWKERMKLKEKLPIVDTTSVVHDEIYEEMSQI